MRMEFRKKGITLLMFLFGLATLIGGNVFLFSSNKIASALGADNSVLLVQKINRDATDLEDNAYAYLENVAFPALGSPVSYLVNHQDSVMLNNYNADSTLLTTEDPSSVENILVTFGGEGSIIMLQASAWLNGEPINLAGTITSSIKNGLEVKQFLHTLDLKTLIKLNNQEPFTNMEGYYQYLFRYRYTDGFATSEELSKTIGFWLLDENNYMNLDGATPEQTVIPKLYNTEKIDRSYYEGNIEHNYFNYNNFNNSLEYNPTSTTNLLFPTFVYDASRYELSYTKQLYGVTSNITSKFQIVNNEGQVSFYLNGSATPFKVDTISKTTIANKDYYFYDNFTITEIGTYNFSVRYLFKQSTTNFIASTTSKLYDAHLDDNNVVLSVFGYQIYYSQNNTGEAEFKGTDGVTTYITDYSNQNETYFNNYNTTTWEPTGEPDVTGALASTNQAPVFLKSLASLKYNDNFTISRSYYNYYVSGFRTGTKVTAPYTNNTRFTQNGYYEVVVLYNFQDYQIVNAGEKVSAPQKLHMQVFAFKIANLPPTVNLSTSTGQVVTSGKFTNASYVSANWTASGIFDVAPSATLWRQNFDGFNPYTQPNLFNGTYENVNGVTYSKDTQITNNGHYTLKIFYGPSRSTSIIYKFTIDKNPISNFQVYAVSSGTDESDNTVYLREDDNILTNRFIVDTPFTLNWNAKASGASINAKYSFTSIAEKTTPTYEQIEKDNQIWVTNGYESKSTFTNLNYYKTNSLDSGILNANSVLKDASIYLFTLTDQAGNTYSYYVVLENTKAQVLQNPPSVSKYNFVPTTTTLTWGTHKAIEISTFSSLTEILNNPSLNTSVFDTYNGTQYLLVPIDLVKIYAAGLSESDKLTQGSLNLENQRIRTFTKQNDTITPSVTFYTGYEAEIPEGSEDLTGEKIYHTYVTDNSTTLTSTNLTFDNVVFYDLKMNLDRSQGTAETYGTVKGSSDDRFIELELERGSNRQFMYFSFKNTTDDYQIETLTYSFYPLTFEQASPYYPFASTPTLNMDLLSGATLIEADLYRTARINTVYATEYGKEVTMPGMYIITRTYVAEESVFGGTGDTKTKTYAYYIDRYNIIEQLDDLLIGEYIELHLGQVLGRDPVIFKDFLISTTKATLVETNLLPVEIYLPQNKYSSYNIDTGIYSSGIGSFDLQVELIRKYRLSNGTDVTQTISALNIVNGRILLPQLYKNGTYEVIIKDKTGYGINLTGSNEFRFSFEIKNNKPTGTFYGTPYNGQDIALLNVGSTNEDNLSFTFLDPIDIYSAKIDANNIEVAQQLKGSSTKTIIYQKINGVVVENEYGMSFNTTAIGYLIGSNNSIIRNRYNLQLFIENSPLAQVEATYEVTIRYEGLEQHYIYENNNFYNNVLKMTIDRTAPAYNLNRLITADTYLTADQKVIVKNASAEINTQNYPFAITSTFDFKRATGTSFMQDTNLIYYRKYEKYKEGEQYLQSLIPGDANYDNYSVEPTRPRFHTTNSIYTAFGYNLGSFLSQVTTSLNGDYYEIIEIDEAGNHTIYTIQVFTDVPELNGRALLEEPEAGNEPVYSTFTKNYSNQTVLDALDMYVESIDSADPWYTFRITNNATNAVTELKHTPATVQANFITQINAIIEVTEAIRVTGASFKLNLINRINKGFQFNYNIQGQALLPTFVDNANSFVITLPQDTPSTTIEAFYVYRSINGEFEETPTYRVYYDMNGLSINSAGLSGASYEFEVGEYYFYFVDNFNRSYRIPKIFGLQDIASINFEGATTTVNGKLYTANDVTITYQTQLYNVTITRNNATYSVPTAHIVKNEQTGVEVISLKNITEIFPIPNGKNGLNDNWVITVYDSANNPTTYAFTIYTETPVIQLTDSLDNSLNHIIEFSTTKPVYISYVNTPILPYSATLTLERLDSQNNPIVITYGTIDPEFGYYLPGTYTLSFQNILGTYVEYEWVVQETATVIYSVIANVNGLEKLLTPSSVKYNYNDTVIDQYFTKYEYRIDKNPDRNLTLSLVEQIGTAQTGITSIYTLVGDFYDKTFAVTRVPSSNTFLGTSLLINGFYRGGTVYKTTEAETTLSWNEYNLFNGNYIYTKYYYNGNYVGQINDNSVILEDAGIYYFEFYDFAGNMQLFNTQNYYKIVLLSEVLYTMNGLDPINDIIYNEGVTLKIEQINEYNWRSWSNVVTRNGYNYNPIKIGESYIFSEFGLYTGQLTATVTLPNESETKTITASYSFMILNENEAKLSFEYSPQTGYEVLSIVKDGVNVTNQFKTLYNTNTLTHLFLSKDEGGNGNYVITVKANYLTLKPSQTFSFHVWVNNESPIILSSVREGSTTTKNIMLSFNKYLIYQQVGDSVIKINGIDAIIINAETSSVNQITNYELSSNATYLVQLKTNMGNTVLSFKVIKKAPLNSVALILIVVGSLLVVTLIVVFIRLRTKMRVS